MKIKYLVYFLLFISISCNEDFLNAKPDKSLIVPTTLEDFQALLNNDKTMNVVPAMGVLSSDNYYTTTAGLQSVSTSTERNAYTWEKDIYQGEQGYDWNKAYKTVFYANVVLKGLQDIKQQGSTQIDHYNEIKGEALFFRAYQVYFLASLFCKPYDSATASTDLGIPIRLSPEAQITPDRGTVEKTYKRIISDLKEAAILLPSKITYKARPSRPAALGMLARVYLTIDDYQNALLYADSCLLLFNNLLNYQDIDTSSSYSFKQLNEETIFYAQLTSFSLFYSYYFIVDSSLYKEYSKHDLRKYLFYDKISLDTVHYKGSYTGNGTFFGGIATDEIYLIKAECLARNGQTEKSLQSLNYLLKKRFEQGKFNPFKASSVEDPLKLILTERRKELIFRGLRWIDLRRLNKDSRFAVTIKRKINGNVYKLKPDDPRYVLPIPDNEITGSNIQQNIR